MIRLALASFILVLMINLGSSNLNIDDVMENSIKSQVVELNLEASTTVTCEPSYGFLPCTTKVWGKLFLILVYEYLLSLGEWYVSDGSELFLKIVGPGIFGASLFHILSTIPEILLVLVSGLSGSIETAEKQAAMGMCLLAGSAVMHLTLVWGSCVAFGSTSHHLTDPSSQKPTCLTGFGVSTDIETSYTARIMLVSMVPLIILQLAKVFNSSSVTRVTVLVSLLVTLAFLFAYSFYQVFQPWIQRRRFEYLTQKIIKDKLLRLLTKNGKPNVPLMKKVFHEIDKNKDTHISTVELRVLVLGIQLQEDGYIKDDYLENIMEEFDISGDAQIDEEEFVRGISKWLLKAQQSDNKQDHMHSGFLGNTVKNTDLEEKLVAPKKKNQKTNNNNISWWIYIKAAYLILVGTAILAALAHPLIQTVGDFATALNIPSFFVPYIVIPLALNYRKAMSAISSARHKTKRSVSLTLSQIYGGVFMNNMIGLTVFLSLVYVRDLSWDVSAEVLVVLIICSVMGLSTSFCTKFPVWTSFLAYLLYPISLLLLYILTTVMGWS